MWLPAGVRAHRGRERWPPQDTLKLPGGALLKHTGEWMPIGRSTQAKVFRGPHELSVLVSLDDHGEPLGELLHMSLSLPHGYPDWDLIFAVTRAVFGTDVDAHMPIPREEAFVHGAVPDQIRGKRRQVFHVIEMPVAWPREGWL
jgi:hypothetical protein